ncbi:MAG: DUF58 domain-containing protein [Planctomycetaceae bacterium]
MSVPPINDIRHRVLSYPPPSYIDPATLMRIESLELRARSVVEGFMTGLHRSPYHGFSVEFTEYRQYVPGDDPRYLDWKLYARSDRYYVKRYEDETNLRCHLILDQSRSMQFGSVGYTKADYARTLTATLAYFLNSQRDAIGLCSFSAEVDEYLPPRFRPGWLRRMIVALEKESPGKVTDLARVLATIAERTRKRSLLVLVSDFLAPIDELETQLGLLRAARHEVAVFQILDPAECTLAFDAPALFEDLETGEEIYVDPETARADYIRQFEQHQQNVQAICERLGIQVTQLQTSDPLEQALADFLRLRQMSSSRRM